MDIVKMNLFCQYNTEIHPDTEKGLELRMTN